jgi:thiosulfate/3-mercaptopyruvate sulfurtransferase
MSDCYLVEAEELGDICGHDDVLVIDSRDAAVYNKGHIPGAVNINDIFTYLCRTENGGYSAMALHFEQLFKKGGLRTSDQAVIYEDAMDNGYGQSCRGWFLLNYLGHKNVRVLHGGIRAWNAKKLPLSTDIPNREPGDFKAEVDSSIIVTNEQMLKAIDNPSIVIVDVRDYAEWIGANSSPYGYNFSPRKGRIPGAVWLEWYRLMRHKQGIAWFRGKDEILGVAEQLDINPETEVYVYCFKGARTANSLLALKQSGIKKVSNYFMSWNEWSCDFSLPIEEGYPDS